MPTSSPFWNASVENAALSAPAAALVSVAFTPATVTRLPLIVTLALDRSRLRIDTRVPPTFAVRSGRLSIRIVKERRATFVAPLLSRMPPEWRIEPASVFASYATGGDREREAALRGA